MAAILGQERLGTGVAVGPDRILTAHYLVMGATRVEVTGFDGRERTVRRTAIDHTTGLALITLDGPALRTARLEEAAEAQPGLPVFLLTCARDGQRKATTGHVSAVGPFEAFWEYMLDRAIMTTAINPGLAGAPLFDLEGRLLECNEAFFRLLGYESREECLQHRMPEIYDRPEAREPLVAQRLLLAAE